MTETWFAAEVQPGRGRVAEIELGRKGYERYLPVVRRAKVVANGLSRPHVVTRDVMLFPGYIFVKFDLDMPGWKTVNGTRGVVKLLPVWLERPSPLPSGFVEALRTGVESGKYSVSEAAALSLGYRPKDRVRVESGPFAGETGEYICTRRGAMELLMDLLGAPIRVKVPLHQVAAASGAVC